MITSILIPCFNASAFLTHTLKAAIENMESQDEVIIVDYHSDDNSVHCARQFLKAAEVQHTVAINPGKGACSARNHALKLATGNLIQWLDADDILAPGKISLQRQHLIAGVNTLVVSPFQPFIGNPREGFIEDQRDWSCCTAKRPSDWLASGRMTIPACWLGHRSVFDAAGPWDTSLHMNQDGEYFARALAASDCLHYEPGALAWYRRGVAGSVSSFTPEKAGSLFKSIESIQKTALSLENSLRMRQMVANKYQHAIYTAFPHCEEGIAKARLELKNLPKPTISNPNTVSLMSKGFAFLFGWKSLNRLRMLKAQLSK